MTETPMRLHIVCERDVGLFSLIQQVIANIPWAVTQNRVPVVHFGPRTCYWTPSGYRGRQTVWEYYFEPLDPAYPAARLPASVKALIGAEPPSPFETGYHLDEHIFVTSHFGDHPLLEGAALRIPYQWEDPDNRLRAAAKVVLDKYIRPRDYLTQKADSFFAQHLAGQYVVGVHVRGTDAVSPQEVRAFRRGSRVLSRYRAEIERLLELEPTAKIFVASDEQSSVDHLAAAFPGRVVAHDSVRHHGGEPAGQGPTGWIMPAYIAADADVAAKNGEDAIVEYLLLSRCDYLVHNGSSLARTVLLNAPDLPHTNTHYRSADGTEAPAGAVRGHRPEGSGS
ncbi:hypothetical protein BWI15_12175 [Kribbella sp. ALI-6-A]|uniref:hypothetical protein n=1 Tax=Kribbella sp. ALI-6-A TaxID=1933817 RepID=UPI00097C7A01|nr:hypothetical protein [Kribbella sp. ALI-6-A]ONI74118.1 hypothetical protein BWI15_12175 [Kribbella sp. ALI-6-A]